MPGAITAPLLIAASVYLLVQTRSVRTRFKDELRYKVAHEVAFGPSGPHFSQSNLRHEVVPLGKERPRRTS